MLAMVVVAVAIVVVAAVVVEETWDVAVVATGIAKCEMMARADGAMTIAVVREMIVGLSLPVVMIMEEIVTILRPRLVVGLEVLEMIVTEPEQVVLAKETVDINRRIMAVVSAVLVDLEEVTLVVRRSLRMAVVPINLMVMEA